MVDSLSIIKDIHTIYPGSSYLFYIVTLLYKLFLVTTSWTYSSVRPVSSGRITFPSFHRSKQQITPQKVFKDLKKKARKDKDNEKSSCQGRKTFSYHDIDKTINDR